MHFVALEHASWDVDIALTQWREGTERAVTIEKQLLLLVNLRRVMRPVLNNLKFHFSKKGNIVHKSETLFPGMDDPVRSPRTGNVQLQKNSRAPSGTLQASVVALNFNHSNSFV